jgi:hypothetical protein
MQDYGAGHEDAGLPRTVMIHVNQHRRNNGRDAYIQYMLGGCISLLEKVITPNVKAHCRRSCCCRPEAGQNVGWNLAYMDVGIPDVSQLSGVGRENKGRHVSKVSME